MIAVTTDRITTTAATRTTRSLAVVVVAVVEAVVEAAAVPGLLRVKMTAAAAPHSPANTNDRSQVQTRNAGWGPPPPLTRNGGWDMPIIVHDAVVLEDATSAASPEAGTVPSTSAVSPEAGAVPATSAA
ncbi:hypothetical protein DYB31_015395 [Aphanomyces astaci]|uniref:Uncharacterized protein n=1 Tax=Aphanomyces astaci TaxID=112090 RepID=A0A397EN87_APHAT|nr:hypothetical protein DYB31_015395 [Aphanomyces astaci]